MSNTPPSQKNTWGHSWMGTGLLLKHNWGCCRCRQGFPGARHTALLSCPYNTILGLYLDADTHTAAPLLLAYLQSLQPNSSSILGSCHFQTFVSEHCSLSSYYWQGRINQTQYLQTHNSFCISSVAPDQAHVLIDPHFWPSGSSSLSANGTFVAFAASPTFGL